MHLNIRNRFRAAFALLPVLACTLAPAVTLAQDTYPSKPVSIVIGYPAGGSVDAVGRALAETMGRVLRSATVVENVGGASGAIAVQKVINARADGYTLILGTNSELAGTAIINATQKYDALKDLAPVGFVGTIPMVLLASRQSGITDLNQFIAEVRKKPGKFSYGTAGVGSPQHFSGELMKMQAHFSIVHIPYRGATGLASDLTGGTLDFAFIGPGVALPFIESQRMVPIGVTSAARSHLLPAVPALGEHPALKGYSLDVWYALMAPKSTPPDVMAKLGDALQASLADPELMQKLKGVGIVPATGKENVQQIIARDVTQYKRIAAFAGMRQ